jgi:hypothetical protein
MTDISEVERLRRITNLQTSFVLSEAQLTEAAISQNGYEQQDDPNVFNASRGRPTAIVIPFSGTRLTTRD